MNKIYINCGHPSTFLYIGFDNVKNFVVNINMPIEYSVKKSKKLKVFCFHFYALHNLYNHELSI